MLAMVSVCACVCVKDLSISFTELIITTTEGTILGNICNKAVYCLHWRKQMLHLLLSAINGAIKDSDVIMINII